MKRIVAALLLFTLAGCASAPSGQSTPSAAIAPAQSPAEAVASPFSPPAKPIAGSNFPNVPDGALYTLYCMTIATEKHVPDSETLKAELVRKTGSHDWYVIHNETDSKLYYGFYKSYDDTGSPQEKQRAQTDRMNIAHLAATDGNTPFALCGFVPLASPDPTAPPEWDLRNTPKTAFWAWHIASYTGSPLRKQYAVDAVRQARAMGVSAYYYHGPSVSEVLIGTWPEEAIEKQDSSVASSLDPGKTLVVLDHPLPPGYKSEDLRTSDGKPAKVVVPRLVVLDPALKAVMAQYPNAAENGQEIMRKVNTDKGVVQLPDPSFLVQIPHDEANDPATSSSPSPVGSLTANPAP